MCRFYGAVFCSCTLLLAACKPVDPPRVTDERAVYEALFRPLVEDKGPRSYLASATETAWFRENPYSADEWIPYLDDLGGISLGLVEELYCVNQDPRPIETNPAPAIVEFLPPEFADPPTRFESEKRCLVGEDQSNIGIRDESGLFLRAYITVSRVAFSADGTLALIKFSHLCAPLSGGGEYFVSFRRSGDGWEAIGGRKMWVS